MGAALAGKADVPAMKKPSTIVRVRRGLMALLGIKVGSSILHLIV
jgi:hypothetical protein